MTSWKEILSWRRSERLHAAVEKGFIKPEEIEPDYIEIPEEPDPNWTDEPMKKVVRKRERQ